MPPKQRGSRIIPGSIEKRIIGRTRERLFLRSGCAPSESPGNHRFTGTFLFESAPDFQLSAAHRTELKVASNGWRGLFFRGNRFGELEPEHRLNPFRHWRSGTATQGAVAEPVAEHQTSTTFPPDEKNHLAGVGADWSFDPDLQECLDTARLDSVGQHSDGALGASWLGHRGHRGCLAGH
jgi:hypothetical protein